MLHKNPSHAEKKHPPHCQAITAIMVAMPLITNVLSS